jgi:DNA-directed RNA polymerase specialized sigma subunit
MDARRGMTKEAVELTQSFATKRYKQVFSILTAPSKSWVDKRLGSDAADYWIQCEQTDLGRIAGESNVYRLKENEHEQRDYTPQTDKIHWPPMDRNEEFQALDARKVEVLETDEDEQNWYHREEVEEMIDKHVDEVRTETRNEIITRLNDADEFTQADIAGAMGISRGRVSQIANA